MSLNETPRANRLHIAIFGKQNSGKSTLLNAITNQDIAIVSETKGATADPVYKSMEIVGIGPTVLIDTAGFDDKGDLGQLRVEKTREVLDKTDVALMVVASNVLDDYSYEKEWIGEFKKRKIPYTIIVNNFAVEGMGVSPSENSSIDKIEEGIGGFIDKIKKEFDEETITVDAKKRLGRDKVIEKILEIMPEKFEELSLTLNHIQKDDVVLLIMPQDIGAPKGRLILPQVQTTRDLLDNKCTVISVTHDRMEEALKILKKAPDLIITDSQVFPYVYERKPEESRLTSFSVLFAEYKGDRKLFEEGMKKFESIPQDVELSVLIAEACTHAPQTEDIGRVKIPKLLKKKYGDRVKIEIVSGRDFPENLSDYDLIIHCGGCMFNRKLMMSRLERIMEHDVNVTNYGIFLANMAGILDKID